MTDYSHKQLNPFLVRIFFAVYALTLLCSAFFFDGIGDSGDSIMHYLISRYAPVHPELFFDHWGKPVFVMLSFPFANLGFFGMKVFNVAAQMGATMMVYRVAQGLNLERPFVVTVFMIFAPLNYVLTFSGLTEPLFSFWIALFLYLHIFHEKPVAAAIVVSFLPFVRSEGLVILGVIALYYLFTKQTKLILALATGHIVLSLAGWRTHGDLLWVFNRIPYASTTSPYGSGGWGHFVNQLLYVVGIPIYVLTICGLICSFLSEKYRRNKELLFLISVMFLVYLLAHSAFWALGIFNSMGLKRVLIGIMPCIALLGLIGFNTVCSLGKGKVKIAVSAFLLTLILVFPFLGTPSSLHWEAEMKATPLQKNCREIAAILKPQATTQTTYWFASPYLAETLDLDYFDVKVHRNPGRAELAQVKPGDFIIWDSHFWPEQTGISREEILNNYGFSLIKEYPVEEGNQDGFIVLRKR